MKKWFFRFLKAGVATIALLILGVVSLYHWAVPNPRDIALIAMAIDPSQGEGAGFIANATEQPWVVYIAASNRSTGQIRVSRIWATTDRLQGVAYGLPAMTSTDKIEFRIIYAKKLAHPKDTSLSAALLSLQPSPEQSPPLLPGPVPKAPGAATPAP